MQKLIIFGTYHNVQGLTNFPRNVNDPDYETILDALIGAHHVDSIFEEASRYGPSTASKMASEMVAGRYVDIDSETTEEALAAFPEPAETRFLPHLQFKSQLKEPLVKLGFAAQNWKESCWVKKIKAEKFSVGLVICGATHALSVAFRLQEEEFAVEIYTYEPIQLMVASLYQPTGTSNEPTN